MSYAFPPDSSIGALRWEKLVAYGAGRGWGADVVAMDPADASPREDSRLAALPGGTRVYSARLIRHPYLTAERYVRRAARLGGLFEPGRRSGTNGSTDSGARTFTRRREQDRSLRGRLWALRQAQLAWLYYDEWRRWCDRATAVGTSLARENDYRVIVSCGPPQMAHEAGRRIGAATGLPFVMDLRDPWHGPSAENFPSPTWRRLTARYERACVEAAALVVANTVVLERDLRARYPGLGNRFMTVMNGADPEVGSAGTRAPRFTIIHAGALYNGRDPRTLLGGLREAIRAMALTADQICLRFLGGDRFEGVLLTQLAEEAGVGEFVRVEGRVSRSEALRALGESAMVVVLPQNQSECIPGKLFEYVQMPSWLLAITSSGSATDLVLRDTPADVVRPEDVPGIAAIIARRYAEFSRGVRPTKVNVDGRFDREKEADKLFTEIERRFVAPAGS